jgi:hypothetical protein
VTPDSEPCDLSRVPFSRALALSRNGSRRPKNTSHSSIATDDGFPTLAKNVVARTAFRALS